MGIGKPALDLEATESMCEVGSIKIALIKFVLEKKEMKMCLLNFMFLQLCPLCSPNFELSNLSPDEGCI